MAYSDKNKKNLYTDSQSLIRLVKKSEGSEDYNITDSWGDIEKAISGRKRRYYIKYVVSGAAIILLLLTVSINYLFRDSQEELLSLSLLDKEIDYSAVDTIVMVTSNQTIYLDNDLELVYDNDGEVALDESAIIKSKEKESVESTEELIELIVPNGKRIAVTLSDGTRMRVNSGSRVVYPGKFNKGIREILVNGEIYLDVAPEKDRPFLVRTNDMQVKVLGTTFNICSYKEEDFSSVVLVKGSVEVNANGKNTIMKPSQMLKFSDVEFTVEEVDTREYTSWIDNMLYLNKRQIGEVFGRLSRYYNRKIVCSEDVALIPLSGKLDLREVLEESIDIICLSLSLNYSIDEFDTIIVTLN